MNSKYIKFAITPAAFVLYFAILRFAAPSVEPYFILGLGVIGYIAWLHGTIAGIAAAGLLVPLTYYIYAQFEISISYTPFASSPAYIGIELLAAAALGLLRKKSRLLKQKEAELAGSNANLRLTLNRVREIGGIHTICSSCKNIRDDDGKWMKIDAYLLKKTKIEFSHGICPNCAGTGGKRVGRP